MVLVASKIDTILMDILPGSQMALPSVSTFDPFGSPDLLWTGIADQNWPTFVSTGVYNDPNFDAALYGISDTGFIQFTDTINIGSIPGGYSGFSNIDGVLAGGMFNYSGASGVTNILVIGTLFSASGFSQNDGAVSGGLAVVAQDLVGVDFGLWTYDNILTPAPLMFPDALNAAYFGIGNTPTNDFRMFRLVPDGGGGFDIEQCFENPDSFSFPFTTINNSGRNYTIGNFNSYVLIDWTATNFGDPFDNVIDTIEFDDAQINADLAGSGAAWFNDGTYFYGVFSYDDLGNPIQPYIVRVNLAWTEYTLINTTTSDAGIQAILDDFFLGNTDVYFMYSPADNALLFTGGVEPTVYGIGYIAAQTITAYLQTPIPPIQALNCQNYCIPLYKTRS